MNTRDCNWNKCVNNAERGINSFDPFLQSKDNLSEVVAYCDKHLEMIRSGKFEKPYKPHQEFYYLNTMHNQSKTIDPKINERIRAMFKLYGC